MKKLKFCVSIVLAAIISIMFAGCDKNKNNNSSSSESSFVGIAIYQKCGNEESYNNLKNNPNNANNLIETRNNKISYNESVQYLFYVYSQNKIEQTITKPISNTTTNSIIVNNSEINFEFERIIEDTDILIFYIYKQENTYILKYVTEQTNITESTTIISLGIEQYSNKNVTIKLQTNITSKTEY